MYSGVEGVVVVVLRCIGGGGDVVLVAVVYMYVCMYVFVVPCACYQAHPG